MARIITKHTSDIRLLCFSTNIATLYGEALLGMFEIISKNLALEKQQINRKLQIKSLDQTSLLVDFLNEALYLSQINKEVYTNANFIKLTDTELIAVLKGYKVDKFDKEIKAVTYHEAEIKKNEKGEYEVTLVLDI